jgi:hypothetical protein
VTVSLLAVVLPPLALWAGCRSRRLGALDGALAGLLAWQAIVTGGGLLLGQAGLLRPLPFAAIHAGLALVFAGLLVRPSPGGPSPARPLARILPTRRGRALAFLAGLVLLGLLVPTVEALVLGIRDFDGLAYHVPRALFWARNGGFVPFETPDWHQVGLPVAADVLLGAPLLLGGEARTTGWATLFLTLGIALALVSAARTFGLNCSRALGAAMLFLAFPITGQRVGDLSSDAAAAFAVLGAFALALRLPSASAAAGIYLFGTGLGVAAKVTIAPFAALLAIPLAVRRMRAGGGIRVLAGASAGALAGGLLVVASFAPVVAAMGDPLGGPEGRALSSTSAGLPAMAKSSAFAALAWVLEPLGYVPRPVRDAVLGQSGLGRCVAALGPTDTPDPVLPNGWPSTSRTGIVPIVLLPIVLARAPRRWAVPIAGFVAAGFVLVQAPLAPSLSSARFGIPLVAAVALALWLPLRLRPFLRRALPLALSFAMAFASLAASARWAVVAARQRDAAARGEGEGLVPADRELLLSRKGGAPLRVLSEVRRRDGLVAGPDADLAFDYLVPAAGADPAEPFRRAALHGSAVLLPLGANGFLRAGPACGPGRQPEAWPTERLVSLLQVSGFRRVVARTAYEIWLPSSSRERRG